MSPSAAIRRACIRQFGGNDHTITNVELATLVAKACGYPVSGMSRKIAKRIMRRWFLEDGRVTAENMPRRPNGRVEREARRVARLPKVPKGIDPASDAFLLTFEWRRLRMEALKLYGNRCMCCGATPHDGAVMNVDHIKPRRLFPALALDIENLQILCHECNHGKGNWDMTDWRPQIIRP